TLLRDRGLDKLLIHIDSLKVVHSLQTRNADFSTSTLVKHIHQLLKNNKHWVVLHVTREANQVANQILKMVHSGSKSINVIAKAPNLIEDLANDKSRNFFKL
ncbi:hypothetical protein Goshw_015232, partial [Gossypium schwendimanii]|nr:hypothetical protein [Gossypium schwendimanii]